LTNFRLKSIALLSTKKTPHTQPFLKPVCARAQKTFAAWS